MGRFLYSIATFLREQDQRNTKQSKAKAKTEKSKGDRRSVVKWKDEDCITDEAMKLEGGNKTERRSRIGVQGRAR